jgi:hypothetical protein
VVCPCVPFGFVEPRQVADQQDHVAGIGIVADGAVRPPGVEQCCDRIPDGSEAAEAAGPIASSARDARGPGDPKGFDTVTDAYLKADH